MVGWEIVFGSAYNVGQLCCVIVVQALTRYPLLHSLVGVLENLEGYTRRVAYMHAPLTAVISSHSVRWRRCWPNLPGTFAVGLVFCV